MTAGNELSFLPDGYLARKSGRRALVIGFALILVVGATVAVTSIRLQRTLGELEARDAAVNITYIRAARKFEPVTKNRDQQRRVIEHAVLAAGLIESVPRSNMLAELTNALPAGTSLLEVTLDAAPHVDSSPYSGSSFDMHKAAADAKLQAEQLAAPVPALFDVTARITGLAESDREVARYLASLTASPLFKDVNLIISEGYQQNGTKTSNLRRFQIQFSLRSGQLKLPTRSDATTTAGLLD